MPGMDGYEATAAIRGLGDPGKRGTPIISMTANAMAGDREKAIAAGMDDYVPKPVKTEALDATLKRWTQPDAVATEDGATKDGIPTPEPDGQPVLDQAVLDQAVLDQAVLEGLRGLQEPGEPELLAELVEVFEQDVPPRLAALREGLEEGDAGTIERTAHTLKGGVGNLGAARMAETARLLEEAGRAGGLSDAPALLQRLYADFGGARAEFSALLLKG